MSNVNILSVLPMTFQPTGFIHRFLSWKLFLPFSRMSYAVYLVHFNFMRVYISHLRKPFYFTELIFGTTYLGILVISFFISFVISVVVEMPFLNSDKLLFPNNSKALESKRKICNDFAAQFL